MKTLRFLLPLGLFALLAFFLGRGLSLNPQEVPSPLIGKPAPAFNLSTVADAERKVRRDELLGQVWILNVWASWCAPCREEHPMVIDIARRKLAPVYGLNYKDKRDNASAWLTQLGDPFQASLFDGDGRVGIDYGVYGVPETFVIDKAGVIRLKHTGPLTPEIVRTRIEPLLKELNAAS